MVADLWQRKGKIIGCFKNSTSIVLQQCQNTVNFHRNGSNVRAFSGGGGCMIARMHTDTHPNLHLGPIDCAPDNQTFPLKRAMSHWGVHNGKLCRQNDFCLKTYLVTHSTQVLSASFLGHLLLRFMLFYQPHF